MLSYVCVDMRDIGRLRMENVENYNGDSDGHQHHHKEPTSNEPQSDSNQIDRMTLSHAIVLALSCSFLVFILMVIVLLCLTGAHKRSIDAVTLVNATE